MNKITSSLMVFMLIQNLVFGQDAQLMDYLLYPRLDSAYWSEDFERLNADYSKQANRNQTCVFNETNSIRGRFCFNTSTGHVKLDSALHHFPEEKLLGKWDVINFGAFEVSDSLLPDSKQYFRSSRILHERQSNNGTVTFTADRMTTALIDNEEIPNKTKRYKILEGKFLTTKSMCGYCGATFIGMTKDGLVILQDLTYRTAAHRGQYLIVKTVVRRLILRRSSMM